MEMLLTFALVFAALLVVVIIIVTTNLFICQPNEVIIFSGRKRQTADGRTVGYRVIKGGRAFRIPLLEKVDRLDLRTIPLEVAITNAYSKGGIPLSVQGIANIKIAGDEPLLGNALERFLGKELTQVQDIAKDTLEGNLRGVLATLTPEEVNEDRLKFAQSLIGEADVDLQKLGLVLDTLKIQNVSDEVGYLDAIGRKSTAAVLKEAEIAEAENRAESQEKSAEAAAAARSPTPKPKFRSSMPKTRSEFARPSWKARARPLRNAPRKWPAKPKSKPSRRSSRNAWPCRSAS